MSCPNRYRIEAYSGIQFHPKGIVCLKRRNYWVDSSHSVTGDAPKDFVYIYDYEDIKHTGIHRKNRLHWTRFIAKVGHKHYPMESITEHLLTRLGECFGLDMAKSRLVFMNGQLRFLSRYFLENDWMQLEHGADILSGYLDEDSSFAELVDKEKLSPIFFTLQFIEEALAYHFSLQKDLIMSSLVKLFLFDALIGNNDRHFFNWGIIKAVDQRVQPHLSPIYDTARGLLWNFSESHLEQKYQSNYKQFIKKYCDQSKPKVGWDGYNGLTHFQLVKEIYTNQYYITRNEMKEIFDEKLLYEMVKIIKEEFISLLSSRRSVMIIDVLTYRFKAIRSIIWA